MTDQTVVVRRQGRVGRISLNRPSALNALDSAMTRAIMAALTEWRDDPAVHAVVVDSTDQRGFCAGGDIRAIRAALLEGRHADVETFFTEEYALNRSVAEFPKPYISLIDGICMGGGMGVSVHGAYRVATEAAVFAMPETGIGLFPDVGMSYVLPRLRGRVGWYMGLSQARLSGPDAMFAGLATHFTDRACLEALPDALAQHGIAALGDIQRPFTPPLAAHITTLDHCFKAASVAEIVQRLAAVDADWARQTLERLRASSPSALLWTFQLFRRGRTRSLAQCLAAELALTRPVTRHPDFAEGVRAMVVDKDRAPKWWPGRLDAVDPATIEAMFSGD